MSGGGVYCFQCTATVAGSTLTSNTATLGAAAADSGYGGGLLCAIGSVAWSGGRMSHNTAESGGGGAALRSCGANFTGAEFDNNVVAVAASTGTAAAATSAAPPPSLGGAMYIHHLSGDRNSAGGTAAGLVTVGACSVTRNTAVLGGGFYVVSDGDNTTCLGRPATCAGDASLTALLRLDAGVVWGSAGAGTLNEAPRGGREVFWVHRRPSGPGFNDAAPAAASMPAHLVVAPAVVSGPPGAPLPTITVTAVDAYGAAAWTTQLLAEVVAVVHTNTTATVVAVNGGGATFTTIATGATATLASLLVAAPPGSTQVLAVTLKPNVVGLAAAPVAVEVTPCLASFGVAADGVTCAMCAKGTASHDGVCHTCPEGYYADIVGAW